MNPNKTRLLCKNVLKHVKWRFFANMPYVQGQEPEPKIREYFYYIDHQGMLFLDDSRMKNFTSCFKEKKFLKFFFNQLQLNQTDRYQEFPFLSKCGRERNFIRGDDYPFVYTHLVQKEDENNKTGHYLVYNNTDLVVKFEPSKVFMEIESGRVYHPAPKRVGEIGLIASKLAVQLSKSLVFENGENQPPTRLIFENVEHKLDNDWYKTVFRKDLQRNV